MQQCLYSTRLPNPLTVFDAPLFSSAKIVQWKWPNTHGEGMHVVMMGILHIEITLRNTVDDFGEGFE